MDKATSAQRHRQLHRRQRGIPPPALDPEEALSSIAESVASAVASVTSKARPGAADDEDDEDDEENKPLSACSVACLTTYLGADCRTVSCMCSNPELATANTCIAAACPRKDRGEFLNNIQSWCGNALAAALVDPGSPSTLSSSAALSRTRSSATELSSAISASTIASVLSASGSLTLSSELSSSVISTSRRVSTITTTSSITLETEDPLETSRINPKGNNAEPTTISPSADSSNSEEGGGVEEKKGISAGTVVGIVFGMILAFVLIGLCTWFVRRSLLGRNKKGKEFLRKSDPGDWVNSDIVNKEGHGRSKGATGAGNGGGQIEFDEKFGEISENDRIDRTMQERTGTLLSNQVIQPGIGAYARTISQTPRSSSGPVGYAHGEGIYPNEHENNNNKGHRQSVKQYQDMHASLAYPSHMGISPSSPYNTHPQFYAQQQQQLQQQHQQIQQMQHQFGSTPHNSMLSMINNNNAMMTPRSAGIDSTMANLSHRDGDGSVQGSPYPESITMTPEISNVGHQHHQRVIGGGGSMDSNGLRNSNLGRHESIPFIIPTSLQHSSSISTPAIGVGHTQNSISYSGSMNGLPRSLTGNGNGEFGDRSSTSTSTSGNGPVGIASTFPQRRLTQQLAQNVPLPPSSPIKNGNAPLLPSMPLPGMTNNTSPDAGDESNDSSKTVIVKKLPIAPAVPSKEGMKSENPFLEMDEDDSKEKKRESFTGLAYLDK